MNKTIYLRFILLCFCLLGAKNNQKFYINDLIEENGQLFKKFKRKKIEGLIFRKIKDNENNTIEKFVGEYTQNGKNGKWIRRWKDGKIKSSGYYKDSNKEGIWEEFNQEGKKAYQLFYENGIIVHIINLNIQDSQ